MLTKTARFVIDDDDDDSDDDKDNCVQCGE
jgi:hypothetical protein